MEQDNQDQSRGGQEAGGKKSGVDYEASQRVSGGDTRGSAG